MDWAHLHSANAHAVSPDGDWILYTVGYGGDKGTGTREWWLIHPNGEGGRKIELPKEFEPDGFSGPGTLYGIRHADGKSFLCSFDIAGIDAASKPLNQFEIPERANALKISPDGKRFAMLADPRPKDPLDDVHQVIEAPHESLYVIDAGGTDGKWWAPDLKDVSSFAWSADGRSLALLSTTPKIGYHSITSWIDLCREGSVKRLGTVNNSATGIAFSSSGKEVLFVSTTTSVLTPDHLWSVPIDASRPPEDVTPKFSGSVMAISGDPHGKVWVSVDRGVRAEIDSYADGRLEVAAAMPEGVVDGAVFPDLYSGPDQLAFNVADPTHAQNIGVPGEGASPKRITTEGDEYLASNVLFGPIEDVHWRSKEGVPLEGIVTFPAGYEKGRRYPFVVFPHGGPEGNDLYALDSFARILAGFGYVVLQPQYRGSTGYGSEFLNSIYQHFGDRAYRDVGSATDYAIAQGWADPNRLAMFGWSAGGFMTSWTVTQTNRYKAAVEGAGITDWGSFMWTSDVQQFDYDARMPHRDPGAFTKFSAVMFADKVQTPLLILHGAADQRVPTYQGREYFESLLALGKTTRMVTYPGSGHFPNRWDQIVDVFNQTRDWLKRYDP